MNEKLDATQILKKIEERRSEIKRYDVTKIGLFGSFAKNTQGKKSDIDVLVHFNRETFDSYMGLLFLLEKMFRRKIDLVVEKDLHPQIKYVKKEAKYARL